MHYTFYDVMAVRIDARGGALGERGSSPQHGGYMCACVLCVHAVGRGGRGAYHARSPATSLAVCKCLQQHISEVDLHCLERRMGGAASAYYYSSPNGPAHTCVPTAPTLAGAPKGIRAALFFRSITQRPTDRRQRQQSRAKGSSPQCYRGRAAAPLIESFSGTPSPAGGLTHGTVCEARMMRLSGNHREKFPVAQTPTSSCIQRPLQEVLLYACGCEYGVQTSLPEGWGRALAAMPGPAAGVLQRLTHPRSPANRTPPPCTPLLFLKLSFLP